MSSEALLPDPLTYATLDDFRRAVVGLAEPAHVPEGMAVDATVVNESVLFCRTLADLRAKENPGDVKMWDYVLKALGVAAAACDGRSLAEFASLCLAPLGIDETTAVYDPAFQAWLTAYQDGDVRASRIIDYLSGPRRVIALTRARQARREDGRARGIAKAIAANEATANEATANEATDKESTHE